MATDSGGCRGWIVGGPRPVGSVKSKTARACARANFSHIYFYTNFVAKITANRLVSTCQ